MTSTPETNRKDMKAPIPAQITGCLNHPSRKAVRLHFCKECLEKWEQKKEDFAWITKEANHVFKSEFDDEYYGGYKDGTATAGDSGSGEN